MLQNFYQKDSELKWEFTIVGTASDACPKGGSGWHGLNALNSYEILVQI